MAIAACWLRSAKAEGRTPTLVTPDHTSSPNVARRPGEGTGGGARAVAETVQHFITAMDSLKLNLVAVDQVRLRLPESRSEACFDPQDHQMIALCACLPPCPLNAGAAAHAPPLAHPEGPPPTWRSWLQICPILSDLISSMSKIESLPPDFAPKDKAKSWYVSWPCMCGLCARCTAPRDCPENAGFMD